MTRRRRQDLLIALGALAVILVAALEISGEVRADRDHPTAVRGDASTFTVKAVTDDAIAPPTDVQRQAVADGLAGVQRWLGRNVGAVVTRSTDVLLTDHDHCARHADDPAAAGVTVNGRKICLFTADTRELSGGVFLRQAAAHEAVHVLQFQLGCGPSIPSWLLEGMAEDLSWRSVDPSAGTEQLNAWTALDDHDVAGHLNYGRAMRTVLELDGGSPARLVRFCKAVGDGAPWTLAFAETFGHGPADYDARF